jgi:hypothetical protein
LQAIFFCNARCRYSRRAGYGFLFHRQARLDRLELLCWLLPPSFLSPSWLISFQLSLIWSLSPPAVSTGYTFDQVVLAAHIIFCY